MEIWSAVLCVFVGAVFVWFTFAVPARRRAEKAATDLEAERRAHAVRLEEIEKARGDTEARFTALAADALGRNSESFLRLVSERFHSHKVEADKDLKAREEAVTVLVKPIREELKKVEVRTQELEKAREGAYHAIREQLKGLAAGQTELTSETGRLVKALRQPQTRGRWGEHQLRNVLEMAGMTKHVDFIEQDVLQGGDGASLRPDVIVRLPGGKSIIVDAKTPLQAYLDAVEAEDEGDRAKHIATHVRHIREHVRALSSRAYWSALPETPDFVVMFIPGESIFADALENDPKLFDDAVGRKVLISTPTTLIALVKAIAYGWQQEKLAENAQAISVAGRELYERIRVFGGHIADVGQSLKQVVERYNRSVGSLEGRVLPSARRLEALGAAPDGAQLASPGPVETEPRVLQAPDLVGSAAEAGVEQELA